MRLFDNLFSRSLAKATNDSVIRPTIRVNDNGITPPASSVGDRDLARSDLGNGNAEPRLENPQITTLHTDSRDGNPVETLPRLHSTSPRRSFRGSSRLAGFKTLLRPRRSHRRIVMPAQVDGTPIVSQGLAQPLNDCSVSLGTQEHRSSYAAAEPPCHRYLDIDLEPRKVSDTTTQSHNSEQTSATVCRHPSRSTSTPIALVDREETITQNPFTDTDETIRQIPSSNPFSDPSITTRCSTRQRSSELSGPSTRFLNISGSSEMDEIPLAQRYSSSVLDDVFPRQPSNSGKGLVKFDQSAAVAAFNEFGPRLGLKPLKLVKADDPDPCACQMRGQYITFFISPCLTLDRQQLSSSQREKYLQAPHWDFQKSTIKPPFEGTELRNTATAFASNEDICLLSLALSRHGLA